MNEPSYRGIFFRLLGYLRRISLAVSILLAVGSQLAAIAIVAATGRVVDKALLPHDSRTLAVLIAAIAVLGLIKALLMAGRRLISGSRRSASSSTCETASTRTSCASRSASTTATRPDS